MENHYLCLSYFLFKIKLASYTINSCILLIYKRIIIFSNILLIYIQYFFNVIEVNLCQQNKYTIMRKLNYTISILSVLSLFSVLKAQVTIGSGAPPVQGTLLQLKENESTGENASKGLMLPRVELSNINNLFPMFADPGNPGSPNADYINPTYKDEQDKLHTGLVVFNTNLCAPFGKGVFLWNGQNWYPVSETVLEGYSTIGLLPDTLHIPSGADKRPWDPATTSFDYSSSTSPIWSNLQETPPYNGLVFANQATQVSPFPAFWSVSPAIFSVKADIMTSPLITKMNPWATRQSSVTISLGADACSPGISKTVLLNQTNYAITGREPGSADPSTDEEDILNIITISDAKPNGTVDVLSNVRWQAFANTEGGTVAEVLNNYTQTPQGTNLSNGSHATGTFAYNGALGTSGSQFKYVKINLRDLEERAEDFVITIMQCRGNEDLSSVTTNANAAETSNPTSNWGTDVVRHLESSNYEEFYSADFGVAGRWMITNFAANAYDYSAGFTLNFGVAGSTSGSNTNIGYYAYPNNNLTTYNNNPYLGYLYNFAGATAGTKNALNVDQTNLPNQSLTQGICPTGWHVPSDYEWTELENEIIRNTTKYAYNSKNIIDDGGTYVPPTVAPGNYRGNHAPAMTNACETYQGNVQGTSKRLSEGGFGAYFAGEIVNGGPLEFGNTAVYWTSSTADPESGEAQAFYRVMSTAVGDIGVSSYQGNRTHYMAVRCKRN